MQRHHGQTLSCQRCADSELALHPTVFIGHLSGFGKCEGTFIDGGTFIADSGEHEVQIAAARLELVADGDDIAGLQGVFRLEEMEIFVGGCGTEDAERGTSDVGFVPREFGIKPF